MSGSRQPFRFQRFVVDDDQCGMKIGTDAVLLGAWCEVSASHRLLDIGTGSGIVALMLAQRTESWAAQVDAIDVEINAVNQAKSNVEQSPWPDRIKVDQFSLSEFRTDATENHFDHCVCNPPYFENSMPSGEPRKRVARHVDDLTRESLFWNTRQLLRPEGRLSLVLPFEQRESTTELALAHDFYLSRETLVRPMPGKPFKRVLLEFSLNECEPIFEELIVEIQRHDFSPEYASLTRGFHLRYAK